jgi:uridine phosphorylase
MDHLIVFAAPTYQERAVVCAALEDVMADVTVEVRACGIGPAAAAALCQRLDAEAPALKGLALIGWAGGLSPGLSAGDVVVADEAVDLRGERTACTAIRLPGARVGPMLTVPEPLLTPEAKSSHRVGGNLAVEMEAYPLAVWAQGRSLPFVHARVILDPVDEALPDLGDALDTFGRIRWVRLVRPLAGRPSLAADLVRLGRRIRTLSPVLGEAAGEVARAW